MTNDKHNLPRGNICKFASTHFKIAIISFLLPPVFMTLLRVFATASQQVKMYHEGSKIMLLALCLVGSVHGTEIPGTPGNDILESLPGKDTIDGGEGIDTASYEHVSKKVTVNLTKKIATGGAGKDKLLNIENVIGSAFGDTLTGSNSDNLLLGQAGNDKLSGGAGKDTLAGGVGVDVLSGGRGADIFRFDNLPTGKANADKITDYSLVQGDLIELDAAVFPIQSFVIVTKLALAKNGERVIYEKSTGRLYYDLDGAGNATPPQLLATLPNKPALAISALAPCQSGCGNGNGTGNNGETSVPFSTYRNTTLPGRLLVNSPGLHTKIYNLQDGTRLELPALAKDLSGDETDLWDVNANGSILTRLSTADYRRQPLLGYFEPSSLAKRSEMLLPDNDIGYSGVRLSADGRYLLSFHGYDRILTVFDASTGAIVEQGSKLDGMSILGFPAAWLPNGEYIYLAGNKLYATLPLSPDVRLLTTLNLPYNTYVASSNLSVSPDGSRLAFTWTEERNVNNDTHVYVVNMDGSGLHRLTNVPDPSYPVNFGYTSPTWSPDGQWVAMVLAMGASTVAPVFPGDDNYFWKVIGTTGCDSSPVMVLPVTAENVAMSWPRIDPNLGIKVRDGKNANWLTTCSGIMRWLP